MLKSRFIRTCADNTPHDHLVTQQSPLCYHNYDSFEGKRITMKSIRPVSDLRNNFASISQDVHETGRPVFLTKNGSGDMVVMSMDAYEALAFESEVYTALREAEVEATLTEERYSPDEVLAKLRARIDSVSKAG